MATAQSKIKELPNLMKIIEDCITFIKYIIRDKPHKAQERIIEALFSGKYRVITACCGRRFGKSKLMVYILIFLGCTRLNRKFAVIAPTYDQSRIIFEEMRYYVETSQVLKGMVKRIKESPYPKIEFKTGSSVVFKSADVPKNLRGRSYHLVILDEAAFIDDATVKNVIEPMLADYNGILIKISTPFGKNHFYDTFLLGQQEIQDNISFQFPSWINPYISQEYLERKKAELGEDNPIWRQEYCAEFIDDINNVFKWEHISKNINERIELLEHGSYGRKYIMGVDLAKYQDYTVITLLDITEKPYKVIHFERFNQMPYAYVVKKLRELHSKFNAPKILMDSTGVGDPILEQLEDIAEGYKFTNQSKINLINRLVVALEREEVKYPNIPHLINELKYFQYIKTKSTLRMDAPNGLHDDTVISLALAVYAAESKQTQIINNYAYTLR